MNLRGEKAIIRVTLMNYVWSDTNNGLNLVNGVCFREGEIASSTPAISRFHKQFHHRLPLADVDHREGKLRFPHRQSRRLALPT